MYCNIGCHERSRVKTLLQVSIFAFDRNAGMSMDILECGTAKAQVRKDGMRDARAGWNAFLEYNDTIPACRDLSCT